MINPVSTQDLPILALGGWVVSTRRAVTVIIPTIPARRGMLARAVQSAKAQILPPVEILTLTDTPGWGAAETRDRLLAEVATEWVAPLDDDDELYPDHLSRLAACAAAAGADLVYPWYDVYGPTGQPEQWRDPHAAWEGTAWEPARPHQVPVTILARTSVIRDAGGWTNRGTWRPEDAGIDEGGNRVGEDYLLIQRINTAGHRIVHLPERTWRWNHHSSNSSGRPG